MKNLHLFKPLIDVESSLKEIENVLKSGYINEGIQVTELTEKIKKILCTDNISLVNSCTSALTLALGLAGATHGSDVITTSMTCVASNMPIKNLGCNISWADVDSSSGMLTANSIEKALTPQTKAVILVLWAGNVPELDEIYETCKRNNVKLIVDAAHAFLAEFNSKYVHEYSDYTCYSFQAIKHFTTGDGGALYCKDNNDFVKSKKMKWFGLDRDKAKDDKGNWKGQQWDVDIDCIGHKFNMNNVSAALGLSIIDRLPDIVDKHRKNAHRYDEHFQSFQWAKPATKSPNSRGSSWVYTITLSEEISHHRDKILELLNKTGIHAGVVHVPNHMYTCFKDELKILPGVDNFFAKQFSLPCGWWLEDGDVDHIFDAVKETICKVAGV